MSRDPSGSAPPPLEPGGELAKLWAHRDSPDYAQFTEPAGTYYRRFLEALDAWKSTKDINQGSDVWTRQVMAAWGLLARGKESIPFALELVRSKHSDAREQGAFLLGSLGKEPSIVDEILLTLANETDDVARDSMIIALGQLRSRRALPALARIVRDPTADHDSRWTAGESIGRIVRRRFGKSGASVIDEAVAWLDAHPHPPSR